MNNVFSKTLTCLFLIITTLTVFAQTDTAQAGNDTLISAQPNRFDRFDNLYAHPMRSHFEGNLLQATYDLQYSSNMAVNRLAYNFYLQNPLPPSSIVNSIDKISVLNIGGMESNVGFKYLFQPNKEKRNFFFVNYRYTRHQSTEFTNDFGKFFFQGNKQFAGDSIIADDMNYLTTRYDNLQAGWLGFFNIKGKPASLSVSAGLTRGFSYRQLNIYTGRIFTEENGDYVDVRLDMEARQSQFSPVQLLSHSGFGGLMDIDFNVMLSPKSNLSVSVRDLGFISWDDRSAVYGRNDTTVRFTGVFIPSIDSLGSPEYSERIGDSIVTRFDIPFVSNKFTSALPAKINFAYTMKLRESNLLTIRLNLMAFTSYRPQLAIESFNFIGSKFYSITGVAIGGFGPLDVYQSFGWQITKNFFAGLGLFGVEGMLVPNRLSGFGGSINVTYRVK